MNAQSPPSASTSELESRNKTRFLGWVFDKPLHLERFGMMLHRATGLGLLLYLIFHLVVTNAILGGRVFFADIMGMLSNPATHIGEIVVVGAVGFHGINGIRLVLIGLGVISGRPHRPDFPYKAPSLNNAEKGALWTAFGIGVVSVLFASFFILMGG
jgi:succinate dehydrogenase / fumarate reductase cytochrome b subunit